MPIINNITKWLLILLPLAVTLRVLYLLMKMMADGEQSQMYFIKIKNVLIYFILAESATAIAKLISAYYKP